MTQQLKDWQDAILLLDPIKHELALDHSVPDYVFGLVNHAIRHINQNVQQYFEAA